MASLVDERGEPMATARRQSHLGFRPFISVLLLFVGPMLVEASRSFWLRLADIYYLRTSLVDLAVSSTVGLVLVTGLTWVINRYLRNQPDFVISFFRRAFKPFVDAVAEDSGRSSIESRELGIIDDLGREIDRLERRIQELNVTERVGTIPEADRTAILASLRTQVTEHLTDDFLASIDENYGNSIEAKLHLRSRTESVATTRERLHQEINALTRRGNVSLIIGILTTLVAVGQLAYIVLQPDPQNVNWTDLLPTYLLRLSLVVFVELFAFFFLRLYRHSLHEIKYFRNELTNVELRTLALESAIKSGNNEALAAILSDLSRVERNFVLKKGESTTQLERAKLDNEGIKDALSTVRTLADRIPK